MTCPKCKDNGTTNMLSPVLDSEKWFVVKYYFCPACLGYFETDGLTEAKQ